MTPFQVFRLWARRAPRGERAFAAVAAAVVLALLAWVLRPATSTESAAVGFTSPAGAPPAESAQSGLPGSKAQPGRLTAAQAAGSSRSAPGTQPGSVRTGRAG